MDEGAINKHQLKMRNLFEVRFSLSKFSVLLITIVSPIFVNLVRNIILIFSGPVMWLCFCVNLFTSAYRA